MTPRMFTTGADVWAARKHLGCVIVLLLAPLHAQAQDRPPIIDMHLHALAADANGPPPVGACAPFDGYPVWDPAQSFDSVFMATVKEPPCSEPVWSPETDDEVIDQTIAAMERWSMVGVLSGESPDRVATWRAAAPDRFIPGIVVNPIRRPEITPATRCSTTSSPCYMCILKCTST